jgi:hypothetical protein
MIATPTISNNGNKMIKKLLKLIIPPIFIRALNAFRKLQNDETLFDGNDEAFKIKVAACSVYGEYGCGQSTKWVLFNSSALVYSVDSSQEWVGAVTASAGSTLRLKIKWVDMGQIGDWGLPLGYEKRDNFADYTDWIWRQDHQPDLILVDGRFRVACFFTSLLRAKSGASIIFDDYTDRPQYHLVEEIVGKPEVSGRQAIFTVPSLTDDQRRAAETLLNNFRYVMD